MSADGGSGKKTLGSESSCSSGSSGDHGGRRRKDYGRTDRKTVRILTVLAYILCVSLAAVLLSAYYVFLWNPGPPTVTEKPGRSSTKFSSGNLNHHYYSSKQSYMFPSGGRQGDGSRYYPKRSHNSYLFSYGNTKAYQHQQIPTPLPQLMSTQFLTTLPNGVSTTKPTTTSPTPPIFKIQLNPMV